MITVHHISEKVDADLHLFCGRKGSCRRKDLTFADLGNPHWMRDESQRDVVCDRYENDLMDNEDHTHWESIRYIGEEAARGVRIALYCFCAPKRCHCESIRDHALELIVK